MPSPCKKCHGFCVDPKSFPSTESMVLRKNMIPGVLNGHEHCDEELSDSDDDISRSSMGSSRALEIPTKR